MRSQLSVLVYTYFFRVFAIKLGNFIKDKNCLRLSGLCLPELHLPVLGLSVLGLLVLCFSVICLPVLVLSGLCFLVLGLFGRSKNVYLVYSILETKYFEKILIGFSPKTDSVKNDDILLASVIL